MPDPAGGLRTMILLPYDSPALSVVKYFEYPLLYPGQMHIIIK
jgi:hypothetical protein